jgi:hypothetical protein
LPWPHGEHCACPQPPDTTGGLLAYTIDCDHYAQLSDALAQIADQPNDARLRALTFGPTPDNVVTLHDTPVCTGRLDCPCADCRAIVAKRVRQGVRQHKHDGIPIRRRPARAA